MQVHPHSCCLRWPLHRRPLSYGWFSGCHRLGNRNPLGCDHHLPVLWDFCKGAKRSGQHGGTALLKNTNLMTHQTQIIHPKTFFILDFLQCTQSVHFAAGITYLQHLCFPPYASSLWMLRKLFRFLPELIMVSCLYSFLTPVSTTYLSAGCLCPKWLSLSAEECIKAHTFKLLSLTYLRHCSCSMFKEH